MIKDLIRIRHELQKARKRVHVLEAEEMKLLGVYAVKCRGCGAGVNQSCKKVGGQNTRPHQERIKDAVAYLASLDNEDGGPTGLDATYRR
jgi:hypothetical protein